MDEKQPENVSDSGKYISVEELRQQITQFIAKRFDSLSLMSDYYFTAFMQENVACMQVMLRAFMGDDSIAVTSVQVQHVVMNGDDGRGVRYDCLVRTESHGNYDVEIENWPDGSLALRLRYYAAMMDKENLKKNQDYAKLPPLTVIVVTPKDVGGKGKAVTYVGRVCMESATKVGENPSRFEDKELFVFVNANYSDTSTQVGKVIHDLTTLNSKPKLVTEFAEAVTRYVNTEKGRIEMSGKIADFSIEAKDWEHLLSDADRQAAENRGIVKGEKDLAQTLLSQGILSKTALEAAFRYMGKPLPF